MDANERLHDPSERRRLTRREAYLIRSAFSIACQCQCKSLYDGVETDAEGIAKVDAEIDAIFQKLNL